MAADEETAKRRKNVLLFLAEGALLLTAGAYFFYRSPAAVLLLCPLLYPYCRQRAKEAETGRQEELMLQFREAVSAVCVSMQAGYSAENAFVQSAEEMRRLFGENSPICRELKKVAVALSNNVPLEQGLLEFAGRSRVSEIEDFAQIFLLGKRSGMDMHKMIQSTVSLISEKIEVKREIRTILAARKMELNIMGCVPFGILIYIELSSPGFFGPLYHNPAGICIMSGCLLLYLGAVQLGRKILKIPV